MPYILKERRQALDSAIENLAQKLQRILPNFPEDNKGRGGDLNYVITKLLLEMYPTKSYEQYAEAISTLECAKLEFYRRQIAHYENNKAFENSDVYNTPI